MTDSTFVGFVLGLGTGGWAVWFYLRDRISPREKQVQHCPFRFCGWKTDRAVTKEEGEIMEKEHLQKNHRTIAEVTE